jgi:long-chain acyl-CoA synthetase
LRTSPDVHAALTPDRPAIVMAGSGETVTYAELEDRSNRLAQLFRASGLQIGDHVALLMENHIRYLEVAWAALRAGLYFTPVNTYLAPEEAAYILDDCGARVLVTTATLAATAAAAVVQTPKVERRLMIDGVVDGFESYEATVATFPATPIADETEGCDMLYSSGTTGRPKGIRRLLPNSPLGENLVTMRFFQSLLGWEPEMTYLSPAPLYHSAPTLGTLAALRLGGTVVIMERFDAEETLAYIERYGITHAQFVPTMFVRMLKLEPDVRAKYDVSSLRHAVHAAAPCPVPVKEAMIDWWGPVLFEYYAGTEGAGCNAITAEEWLTHKGSVGRAVLGEVHILDDQFTELPAGEVGTVWFGGGLPFEYHNDPEKTSASRSPQGYTTFWDMGYLDDEGYLYLTDRTSFMIVSGGVNIYPQEIENALALHPDVADVAVLGVPNADFGEEVKAVVQPADGAAAGPALADELSAYCREHLAPFKCPRSFDFVDELPRLPTGKLYKRKLKDAYWEGRTSRIV